MNTTETNNTAWKESVIVVLQGPSLKLALLRRTLAGPEYGINQTRAIRDDLFEIENTILDLISKLEREIMLRTF